MKWFKIPKCRLTVILLQVVMKLIALSPKGYWYSRRNRMDLLITVAAVLWAVLHLSFRSTPLSGSTEDEKNQIKNNREIIDSIGYGVIILRFCTITGKHVSLLIVVSNWFNILLTFVLS